MLELCSQCGKSTAGGDARCPHCSAELAVTLPGVAVPEVEGGKVALPAPEKKAEASVQTPPLDELFDDFDPMEEFASSEAPAGNLADAPTIGGFELTPPPAAATHAGDDVLDFIDTGHEAGSTASPDMPSLVSELGVIGFEEAVKEATQGGQAAPLSPIFDPPAAAEASRASAPPAPSAAPPVAPPVAPPAAPPVASIPEVRSSPEAAPATPPAKSRSLGRKHLKLLALGGAVGGLLGVGALFFLGKETPELVFEDEPLPQRAAAPKKPKAEKADGGKAEAGKAEAGKAETGKEAEKPVAADSEAKPEAQAEKADGKAEEKVEATADAEDAGADPEGAEGAEEAPEPEAPPSFFAAAEALEREEKWEEALAAYLEAAGPEKGAPDEAHLRRSRIYERRGDRPRALLEARRAVGENPERLDTRLHLGGLFETMGSLKDARETYEAALASHPDDPALLERLARIHLTTGAAWRAIELLEPHAGDAAPASLRLALGEAYLRASSWTRAEAMLAPLARDPRVAYPLARALLEQGKTRQALPHLERAAAAEEAEPVVHRYLGYAYKELRRRAEAARAFRAYLEASPEALDRPEIEDEIASLTR